MAEPALQLPPVGEPILTLEGVTKHYGETRAAQDVNLAIPRGSHLRLPRAPTVRARPPPSAAS